MGLHGGMAQVDSLLSSAHEANHMPLVKEVIHKVPYYNDSTVTLSLGSTC